MSKILDNWTRQKEVPPDLGKRAEKAWNERKGISSDMWADQLRLRDKKIAELEKEVERLQDAIERNSQSKIFNAYGQTIAIRRQAAQEICEMAMDYGMKHDCTVKHSRAIAAREIVDTIRRKYL